MRPFVLLTFAPLFFSVIARAQDFQTIPILGSEIVDSVPITSVEAQGFTRSTLLQNLYMALHRTLLTSTTRLLRSSPSRAFTDSKYHGKEISRDDESYQSIKNWQVLKLDPRGGSPCFANDHLVPEYTSYDPPRGFTGEQIMQFDGAKDVFESVEEIEKLIELRDQFGTLESKVDS